MEGGLTVKLKVTLISLITVAILLMAAIACLFITSGILDPLGQSLKSGYKYLEEKNYEKAIAAFDKALDINDTSIEAYKGLAYTYCAAIDNYSVDDIIMVKINEFVGLSRLE